MLALIVRAFSFIEIFVMRFRVYFEDLGFIEFLILDVVFVFILRSFAMFIYVLWLFFKVGSSFCCWG